VAGRDELIRDLAQDLRPAPRLRDPRQLALVWLVGSWIFVVGITRAVAPFRPGFAEQLLASPRFAGETLLGLAAGVLAIALVFALGVPGSGSARRRIAWGLGGLALWSLAYVYGLADPALSPSMAGKRDLCVFEVLVYGAPVLLAALLALRTLAPFQRTGAGLLAGAAAGAIPGLVMQLACMYDPAHILSFHIAPIAVLAALGAGLGRVVLRRI
jgi:hypothetical protein